jgi:hypothetical protein
VCDVFDVLLPDVESNCGPTLATQANSLTVLGDSIFDEYLHIMTLLYNIIRI